MAFRRNRNITQEQYDRIVKILTWVKERITANPDQYDQNNWCGTRCCIAGWVCSYEVGLRGPLLTEQTVNNSVVSTASQTLFDRFFPNLFKPDAADDTRFSIHGDRAHAQGGCNAIDRYLEERKSDIVPEAV